MKIGVNGFGAIGGLIPRINDSEVQIGAINGGNAEEIEKAMKYSGSYGKFNGTLESDGPKKLIINGIEIEVSNERGSLESIPWPDDVHYILECTGRYNNPSATGHLKDSNVERVILSAPGTQEIPIFVMGANHEEYDASLEHPVISNASCTTNCLAPVLGLLKNKFSILGGSITTTHAPTGSQPTLDTNRQRSAFDIVPASTGAAKAIGGVFPDLDGKFDGSAARVPTPDSASLLTINFFIDGETTIAEVNQVFERASQDEVMKNLIGIADKGCVGKDFKGDDRSAILVPEYTKVTASGQVIQIQFWYDNEWGYTQRLLDLTKYVAKEDEKYISSKK